MSMQVDFKYPQQLEDVDSVKAAVKGFDKNMRKMMILMKDLGNTLEGVSNSFSSLTTLSFTQDRNTRKYVENFNTEIVRMKEGAPFQDYNRLVHEEVLTPVTDLKGAIKDTEKAISDREKAFKKYKKSKEKVDKTEKKYAKKGRSLEVCPEYPKYKEVREAQLMTFQDRDTDFQQTFMEMVKKVETVTQTTMHRYLELNAAFMASVIEALTNTDASIEDHVAEYRQQLETDRSTEIARRKQEVSQQYESSKKDAAAYGLEDVASGAGSPTFDYNYHQQSSTLRAQRDVVSAEGVKAAAAGPPAARGDKGGNGANTDDGSRGDYATVAAGVRVQNVPQAAGAPARKGDAAETPRVPSTPKKEAAGNGDSGSDGGARAVADDDDDDGDGGESFFGSVSQVNEAQHLQQQRLREAALYDQSSGQAAGGVPKRPVYKFAASTVASSQVSAARPGYMAAQDEAMNNTFKQHLDGAGGQGS